MNCIKFIKNNLTGAKNFNVSSNRVFKRFCEIQEKPPDPKTLTYEQLKQIVVKYSELAKCPELKVGNILLYKNDYALWAFLLQI